MSKYYRLNDKSRAETAIRVKNLTKKYKIYQSPIDRLKDFIMPGLKKRFKEIVALDNVSFDVRRGETLGIVGRNGSGKSTLLKVLSGVGGVYEGEIEINGRLLSLLELGVGFQMDFSGRHNIYTVATLMGLSKGEIDKIVDKIIEFSGLEDFIDYKLKTYSKGMILRLAFSIIIHLNFDILMLDEIMSVGDINFQRKCYKKIRHFKHLGKTILLASHNLADIGAICDRTLYLENGRVMLFGDTDKVVGEFIKSIEESDKKISPDYHIMKGELPYSERIGTIRITNVRFLNSMEQETLSFKTGERMKVVIEFEAQSPVRDPLFRVQFFKNDGQFLAGNNNYRHNFRIKELMGTGQVEMIIESLNLIEGDYYVSVGIWPDEYRSLVTLTPYDLHDFRYIISVKSERQDGAALVYLPVKWALKLNQTGKVVHN